MSDRTKYVHRPKPGVVYFRNGTISVRLPADNTSPEFARAYDELLARVKPAIRGRPSHMLKPPVAALVSGSGEAVVYHPPAIGWAVKQWRASDWWAPPGSTKCTARSLRAGTQHNYALGLNLMRKEGMLAVSLNDLNPRNANLYLQKIKREHGGATALLQKNLLSHLWEFSKGFGEFDAGVRTNPLREVTKLYTVKQEHKPWPEDVIDRFLATCDENLDFAFHLMLCTGQRISDVVKMKWADFDGSHITLVQKKDRKGDPIRIKVPKILLAMFEERARVHDNILTHRWQRPYTRDSLHHRMKEVLHAIDASAYTNHGLRKNAGIMLAENGATVPQIMAALGHKTEKMAVYYVRLAQQKTLADQAADIMDGAFARRGAAKVAARRAQIRQVS